MHDIKNTRRGILVLGFISIMVMFVVDFLIQPIFVIKSAIKVVLFLGVPLMYGYLNRYVDVLSIFKVKSKKQLRYSILLGIAIYLVILGAYYLFAGFLDLDNIQSLLARNLGVDRNNFIFVAIYIAIFNSLLEEFFFRGFLFLGLKNLGMGSLSTLLSAGMFSLYHIAIIANWFNIWIFILVILGLFIGGLIFNALNNRNGNIYNSWLVHMFANLAINTVGLLMFGII